MNKKQVKLRITIDSEEHEKRCVNTYILAEFFLIRSSWLLCLLAWMAVIILVACSPMVTPIVGSVTAALTATASSGGIVPVTVTPSCAVILLTPSQISDLNVGEYRRISATLISSNGSLLANQVVRWSVRGVEGTVIDILLHQGSVVNWVIGRQAGTQAVTATCSNGISASINVTVPRVASILLTPSQITNLDNQQTITATPLSDKGTPLKNRGVTWSVYSANSAIGISPNIGYTTTVTGLVGGTGTVTATSEGILASAPVSVAPVSVVSIAPSSISELDCGENQTLAATLRSADGTSLYFRGVLWFGPILFGQPIAISPQTRYMTMVTGQKAGTGTVTAGSEGVLAKATVSVPKVARISLINSPVIFGPNGYQTTITATPYNAAGTSLQNCWVSWSVFSNESDYLRLSSSSGHTTTVVLGLALWFLCPTTTVKATSNGASASVILCPHQ